VIRTGVDPLVWLGASGWLGVSGRVTQALLILCMRVYVCVCVCVCVYVCMMQLVGQIGNILLLTPFRVQHMKVVAILDTRSDRRFAQNYSILCTWVKSMRQDEYGKQGE
jgi:hypothetical protein